MRTFIAASVCFLLGILFSIQLAFCQLTEMQLVLSIAFAIIFNLLGIGIIIEYWQRPVEQEKLAKPTIKLE
jgi:hypothetical protein